MKFSFRIFLGLFLIIGLASYLFYSAFVEEIKPGIRQSTEDNLIEVSNLLAEMLSSEMLGPDMQDSIFAASIKAFQQRQFDATIWTLKKQHSSIQVYITDHQGRVVYHSSKPQLIGADYSQWNDVYLTLRGQYGARSSLDDIDNPMSSVMHVAAPIYHQQQIIGVLTVFKPNLSFEPFFIATQQKLLRKGWLLLLLSLAAGLLLAWWLSRSLQQLVNYANAVKLGTLLPIPKVHGREFKQLAVAMTAMKDKLEGKQYVENYVHTLAHQLKSPIASIQGAAELLDEPMSSQQHARFILNIQQESQRMVEIVEHMLALAELENRPQLLNSQPISLKPIIDEVICANYTSIEKKQLQVFNHLDQRTTVLGDAFLLQQAFRNLLDNAIAFSPKKAEINVNCEQQHDQLILTISDQGSGIPDYAETRLFERFYSLPRPHNKQKSSGLGLCFVKEIARLHNASITLKNNQSSGVCASFSFNLGKST